MTWGVSALGALVVALVLWDIFRTLLHPTAQGRLAHLAMVAVWRAGRLGRNQPRRASGPLAMVAAILTWAGLVVLGWALVYWPHLPGDFSYSPGLRPQARSDALDAAYVSLVAATTLGLGDVVPQAGWLRIAVPLQALVGFALLTAAVTWVLQLYPALGRRRVLAVHLTALSRADAPATLAGLGPVEACELLDRVTQGIHQVRVDLDQYDETYFFADADERSSLPAALGTVPRLCEAGTRSPHESVRLATTVLRQALDDLVDVLRPQVPGSPDEGTAVLDAYAFDHGYATERR